MLKYIVDNPKKKMHPDNTNLNSLKVIQVLPEVETLVWQHGMEIEQDVFIHHHRKFTNLVHTIVP